MQFFWRAERDGNEAVNDTKTSTQAPTKVDTSEETVSARRGMAVQEIAWYWTNTGVQSMCTTTNEEG